MAGLRTDLAVDDVLGGTEDLLLERLRAIVGPYVKGVEALPGVWDDEMLRRLLRMVPGVFLAFQRAARSPSATTTVEFTSTWSVIVAVSNAGGEGLRRRGDTTGVGAYNLVCALATQLDGFCLGDAGSVAVGDITDLFSGAIEKQGLAVYTIDITVPLVLEKTVGAGLDLFATFDARLDMPQHTPDMYGPWLEGDYSYAPEARDLVLMEQDRLVVSAVFDQVHYWPATKAQLGVSMNARKGADLIGTAPFLRELGANSVVLTIEFDWFKKWGNDGKGNPALVEVFDDNGMPVNTAGTPAQLLLDAELAHRGHRVVLQVIGAPAQFQEATYGAVARHRTPADIAGSGALVAQWLDAIQHVPGAYSVWQENEAMRTLTSFDKGYDVAGEPAYIGETNAEYQARRRTARSKAATDLAQIWRSVQVRAALPPHTKRGLASFVYGDFNASKTTDADPEDDGGTDSNGKLGFVAAMDELDSLRALDAAMPLPDEISLNSFNGKWLDQLTGVRERLVARRVPLSINQIAPAIRKLGPTRDKTTTATPAQQAVAMLSDMAAMLPHGDLRQAHWAYWVGGAEAVLTALPSGGYQRNTTWHALDWMASRLPSRRVVLNGLTDAGAAAAAPGVHGLAGVSARRAAVLLWNDSEDMGAMTLQLAALPATLTGMPYTVNGHLLANGAAEPVPMSVPLVGGFIDLAVPAWSAVLIELLAADGVDPLTRRDSLATGGHTPVLVGAPEPFINPARPRDHGRYDVARDVAYLGLGHAGAGTATVSAVWADLPDVITASAAVFGATAGAVTFSASYYGAAGELLGTAQLGSINAAGANGATLALGLAIAAPAGWAAGGRVARVQIAFSGTEQGALAEVYLSGTLARAQAPYV